MVRTNVVKDCSQELLSAKYNLQYSGLYDLRLAITCHSSVLRISQPLYSVFKSDESTVKEKMFEYVDPKNREVQIEMEQVATHHLKKIGAHIDPKIKISVGFENKFNCEAPIIGGLAPRPVPCPHGCDRALDAAIITAPDARDPARLRRLDAVAGRVLGGRAEG